MANNTPQAPFGIDLEGSAIYEKVLEHPIPCMLLRQDLPVDVLAAMAQAFKIVDVEYEGATYFAVPLAFYTPPEPGEKVVGKILDPWGNLMEATDADLCR
ncbi:MAG: hypothetical protein OXN25_11785 [Candidatus Poribacteria bacterium]|nr:hypothetical protein [Candidatus Poribacteria bacterium]